MLLFDTETDGLVDALTRIHILCVRDTDTGAVTRYRRNDTEDNIEVGLRVLMAHTQARGFIGGHNVIKFDIPAIQKVYPWFKVDERYVIDTLVLTRAIYPDLRELDAKLIRKGTLPKQMQKRHSLEAWGHRLGVHKAGYEGDPSIIDVRVRAAEKWLRWNMAMEDYCEQDLAVTAKLLDTMHTSKTGLIWFQPEPVEAVQLEHDVQWIIARQERHGFLFDQKAAVRLYSLLTQRKLEIESEIKDIFPPFYVRTGELIPKADNKRFGYTKGAPVTIIKKVEFNLGSRDHVALMLRRRYAWEPTEYTNDGKAKIDETVLAGLTYPEAKRLAEFFMVDKRLGQLAAGKEAWLKHVQKDGRIRGGVTTNGAVTGRMTHQKPNIGQTPSTRSPYGAECRALFIVAALKVLVGADADALELRCLAHFMARYDGGDYVKVVLEGKKENGTDIHSVNARALGLDPKAAVLGLQTGRDIAKTWFYAFIYGAGDEKLGLILTGKKGAQRRGKKSRDDFMANLPALGKLVKAVREAVQKRGQLRGLDGRVLAVRSQHAALNTLLQSAGAIVMKRALVILDVKLQELGFVPGIHYEFVANVHDEWQIECDEDKGETIGKLAAQAIAEAGAHYGFRCPLGGAYAIGKSWADTH